MAKTGNAFGSKSRKIKLMPIGKQESAGDASPSNVSNKENMENEASRKNSQVMEPRLVCNERELSLNIEDEIKAGFFELKQKFNEQGHSSIYISHIILHQKHPIFMKLEIETLKRMLVASSVVYLKQDQVLYKMGSPDNFVYFVLFGWMQLCIP